MKSKGLYLYRLTWSHALGTYWQMVRKVCEDTQHLAVTLAQADDPGATYRVAARPPVVLPDEEGLARHVANFG